MPLRYDGAGARVVCHGARVVCYDRGIRCQQRQGVKPAVIIKDFVGLLNNIYLWWG